MPIKNMSWIDINVWIKENINFLRDSVIDNIYGFKDSLILRLRSRDGEKRLLLSKPGFYIFLSPETIFDKKDLNFEENFILLLRRYVRDCKIRDVRQQPCERIVEIEILCRDSRYTLTIELIPRGVIVLRDENNKIKALNRSLKTKDRALKINSLYIYPPKNINIYCEKDLKKLIENFRKGYDLVRGLVVGLGLPPETAEEYIYRNKLDKNIDPKKMSGEEIIRLINDLRRFIDEIIQNPKPCVIYDQDKKASEYYVYQPSSKKDICITKESFNDVLKEYYVSKIRSFVEEDQMINEYIRLKDQLTQDLERISRELENMIKTKDLMDHNYHIFEKTFSCYKDLLKEKGEKISCPEKDEIECVYRIDRSRLKITCGEISFELDLLRDFRDNYIEISKKISQLERGIEKIKENINDLERKIMERKIELEKLRQISEIKRSREIEWFERFHWIITSEGFLAIGGRDIDQNEMLVRKYLEKEDLFFHADIHGGSVFILKKGSQAGERSIVETAHLAGCYSKAWSAGYGSIDVFYVKGEQVSKTPPSGEYLPKGSFMIYGEKRWVKNVRLLLGIGVEIVDDKYPRVIVGDPELIRSRAKIYAIISPGEESPKNVAEKIFEKWIEKHKELEIMLRSLDLEEIIKKIPGRSRVIFIS